MTPQDPPITTKSLPETAPIEARSARAQHMRDGRPVEAFALHNISLLPDQFFWRDNLYLHIEDGRFLSMLKPDVVHYSQTIPRPKDDVYIHSAALNFSQPMTKCVLSRVTSFSPDSKSRGDISRPKKQIKIFGVPINSRVVAQRVGAADQKIDVIIAKQLHNGPANLTSAFRFHSLECALRVVSASM